MESVNNPKQFYVSDGQGGYAEPFEWIEAEHIAMIDSEGDKFRLIHDEKQVCAIFYNGEEFTRVKGRTCEACGKPLDSDAARYSFDMTQHFFCSSTCGIQLGVLTE